MSNSDKASKKEVQEVINLPDDIKRAQGGSGNHKMKTTQEMIAESQKKKEAALNRANNKHAQEISQKSAAELHEMPLVVPGSSQKSQ